MLALDRSRSASSIWGRSAGPVLRSQGTWGQAGLSRCRARGNRVWTFLCLLWTGPAPLQVFGGAPRDRSCARRERGDRLGFRAVARGGIGCGRSYARFGPIPLRFKYLGALRGTGPTLAEEAQGRFGLSRCARGVFGVRLQGSLRTDPAPLGVFLALRGTGPALAGNVGTGWAFALAREGR